jgi:multidrug resistance efflux pump
MPQTNTLLHLLICIFSASLFAEKIQLREFKAETNLRITSFAKEEVLFAGKNRASRLIEVLPNGSHVKKGDVVARLNDRSIRHKIETLENERKTVKINSERNVIKINNDLTDLKDKFKQATEELRSQQAKLNTLKKIPIIEDIKIARSALAVAQVTFDAAQDEFQKGKSRLEKKFISTVEFAKIKKDYLLRKNDLEEKKLELELVRLPANPRELEIAQLNLTNSQLKIERAKKNLEDSEIISASKINSVKKKITLLDTKLERNEEYLNELSYIAPHDGFINHKELSSPVQAGLVIYWGRAFMGLPDLTTTTFQALMPERLLNYYPKGSIASVKINGHEDKPLKAKITKISATPEDAAFRTKTNWGSKPAVTGVKIYLMELTPESIPNWLRPGMSGITKLQSKVSKQLPSISLKSIHYKDKKSYLALNGTMAQVDGFAQGLYFYLNDHDLLDQEVAATAPWPTETNTTTIQNSERPSQQILTLSGELYAVRENRVITPNLESKAKITWLLDEESKVKKGDLVAQLDTTELQEKIEKVETEQAELKEALVTASVQLKKDEDALSFSQTNEKNSLRIAELKKDLALNPILKKDLINKEYNTKSLRIDRDHNQLLLERILNQPDHIQVPREVSDAKLAVEQLNLRLRKAEIEWAIAKDNPTIQQRSTALMAYEASLSSILKSRGEIPLQIISSQNNLNAAKNRVLEYDEELARLNQLIKSYDIHAPSNGTLHYKKLWSSEGIKKAAPGFDVGAWQAILSIPKTDEMIVKALIPENQFRQVKIGDRVKVKIPSLNSRKYTGTIDHFEYSFVRQESIETGKDLYNSQEPSGETHFQVIIKLPNLGDVKVKPGALARIELALRSGAQL